MQRVNVLGQEYEIVLRKAEEDQKLKEAAGYFEPYAKRIVIEDFEPEPMTVEAPERFKRKVLRHELVHAFLEESGLGENSEWARNEELVDWIAKQGEKIYAAWQAAGALTREEKQI